MEYTDDFLKKIISMGALGYPISKVVNVLDVSDDDTRQIIKDFDDAESKIAKAYKKGCDKADYKIDATLYDKAQRGDMEALKLYEERRMAHKEHEEWEREERQLKS